MAQAKKAVLMSVSQTKSSAARDQVVSPSCVVCHGGFKAKSEFSSAGCLTVFKSLYFTVVKIY